MNKFIPALALIILSMPAFGYVGPGMGGGVIAAIIGFLAAIFLGLFGVIYYPIKRALKRKKENKENQI